MGHFIMMRDVKTIGELKEKNEKFYTAKFFTCGDNPDRRYPFDFEYRAREIGESGKSLNDVIRWSECDIVLRDDTPILGVSTCRPRTCIHEVFYRLSRRVGL